MKWPPMKPMIRIGVGILALAGGFALAGWSLGFITIRSQRVETENPHKGLELVELLTLFSAAPSEWGIEWTAGADLDSPITWTSQDRYGAVPKEGFFSRYGAARHGKTHILMGGQPSHEQFAENIRPAIWEISLYGNMAAALCVELRSGGSAYNKTPDLIGALGDRVQFEEAHPNDAATFIGRLYRLSIPGRKPGWLVESWSIGNHTWSVELTIFPGEKAYPAAKELLDQL